MFRRGNINYFKVLGLSECSKVTSKDVKEAYFVLAKKYHPDTAQSTCDSTRLENITKFREISDAYAILKEDKTRAKYLRELMTYNPLNSNEAFEWDGSSSTGRRDRSQEERSRSESFHDHFRRERSSQSNEPNPLDALFHPKTIFVYIPILVFILSFFKSPDPNKTVDLTNRAVLNGPDADKAWFNPLKGQWQTNDKPPDYIFEKRKISTPSSKKEQPPPPTTTTTNNNNNNPPTTPTNNNPAAATLPPTTTPIDINPTTTSNPTATTIITSTSSSNPTNNSPSPDVPRSS